MTEFKETELDERAIKMAKVLSADAVEKAGSGHPGSPVSLVPVAYTLYQHFIKHDPNDPNWEGRDRFILSGGHASLTQYVQLYFSGYGVTLDDLKSFRGSAATRTPGHPEYGLTPGIEMTTGPLGQGFASAIGFAYGERFQRGLLDPETPKEDSPFYHKIWAICGEGDIEEGISGEAASLAANQKLGNLTVIFDANRIQIEGDTNLVLAEDVLKRFQAYGWYTDEFSFIQPDGSYKEDIEGLADVIAKAEKAAPDQPKLIKVHSLIAWPTPGKTNDPSSHGSKLGAEAVAGLKKLLGYDPEESFHVDEEALAHARKVADRGLEAHKAWDEKFDAWRKANPDKAALYDRLKAGELPEGFDKALDDLEATFEVGKNVATRGASGSVLNAIAAVMPELWGGSADLGGSNKTDLKALQPSPRPSAPPFSGRTATSSAASCTSACVSSPWAASPTASCLVRTPVRSAVPSSCSPTTSVPPSVWPPSCRSRTCTSGPTTPSPSARTARPISRSSTWPPSARFLSLRSFARPTPSRPPRPTATSSRRRTRCPAP